MVQLQNRKMPSLGTAWFYIGLSMLFALLSFLQPLIGLILIPIAIALAATGILSIPRLPYYKAFFLSLVVGLLPAGLICLLTQAKLISLSVATFAIAPAIALFVLTIRLRQSRSAGIHWIAFFLTLFYAGAALLFVWEWKGALSATVFKGLYTDARTWFMNFFADLPADYVQLMTEAGFSEEILPDLFKTLLLTTPGFFIAVIWTMAWFASVCLRWLFNHYVYGAERFAKWPVTMTKPLAWIFLISFVAQILPLTNSLWLIPVVACNLYYIFIPAFFVVGCRVIKEQFLRARGCGCFTFILIALTFTMPFAAFLFLSITGAFRTISPVAIIPFVPTVPMDNSQNPQNPQNPDDQGGNPQA